MNDIECIVPVDAQKGTMLDIFVRCPKKKIAQVCTLLKQCVSVKEEFLTRCHPCCNVSNIKLRTYT